MREDSGKPSVFLIDGWLLSGGRLYGTHDSRFINALVTEPDPVYTTGRHIQVEGGTFILGIPLGQLS